jgi:hypothetical protein
MEALIGRMEALAGRLEALVATGVTPEPTDPEAQKAADAYVKRRKYELGLMDDYEVTE